MKRLIEEQLLQWKNSADRKPLIVYGARQVGKSHSLLEFGKKNYANVAYFYLENNPALQAVFDKGFNDVNALLAELGLFCGQPLIKGNTLIILDEIQSCPAAITALKRICEAANDYHVACAGSLLGLALHRDAQYSFPVGKVDMLNLYPLNFYEFLLALDMHTLAEMIADCFAKNIAMPEHMHTLALEQYYAYLAVGGMPESVLEYTKRKDFNFVRAKQLAICEMYTNDMVKYCTKTEAMRNIACYNSIPAQLGKENKKFHYNLIGSHARAKDFASALFWLEKANIIIKTSKAHEGKLPLAAYEDLLSFKIYCSDVGLLAAKSNLPALAILNNAYGGELKDAFAENYVAEQLVANCLKPYYWESKGTAELDFVLQLAEQIVPIEVKSSTNTKAKSLDTFRKKYQIQNCIRISSKNFGCERDIKSVPLYAAWCIKENMPF